MCFRMKKEGFITVKLGGNVEIFSLNWLVGKDGFIINYGATCFSNLYTGLC
ncbi:hypothetical protein BH09BAC5_BH09BAC5_28510 [soil metagenome]